MGALRAYPVWDRTVRWFHWINVLCVLGLGAIGLALLYDDALGIDRDGKTLLKIVHVWIGYVFALNLVVRYVWAAVGGRYSRWRAILPGGRGYWSELRRYVAAVRRGRSRPYLGHNPLGRISVALLLLLLAVQALSGLVLAGTDLFFAPFGGWIAESIAAPGIDPATLAPHTPAMYDAAAYAQMRALRAPVAETHEIAFYALLVLAATHVCAVIVTEIREGGGLVSAMFTGKKVLRVPLADEAQEPPEVRDPPDTTR
jgi:Ni/Fe-hydrogenase 1 B-type cytochrome subunit